MSDKIEAVELEYVVPEYRNPEQLDRRCVIMTYRDYKHTGGWKQAAMKANRRYLQAENDIALMRETLAAQAEALEAKDRIIEALQQPPLVVQSIGRGIRKWDNDRKPGDPRNQSRCWCETCRPITLTDMRMVLCPDCGNKRCPRANYHGNACTGSNEPGQPGSSYPTPSSVPRTATGVVNAVPQLIEYTPNTGRICSGADLLSPAARAAADQASRRVEREPHPGQGAD